MSSLTKRQKEIVKNEFYALADKKVGAGIHSNLNMKFTGNSILKTDFRTHYKYYTDQPDVCMLHGVSSKTYLDFFFEDIHDALEKNSIVDPVSGNIISCEQPVNKDPTVNELLLMAYINEFANPKDFERIQTAIDKDPLQVFALCGNFPFISVYENYALHYLSRIWAMERNDPEPIKRFSKLLDIRKSVNMEKLYETLEQCAEVASSFETFADYITSIFGSKIKVPKIISDSIAHKDSVAYIIFLLEFAKRFFKHDNPNNEMNYPFINHFINLDKLNDLQFKVLSGTSNQEKYQNELASLMILSKYLDAYFNTKQIASLGFKLPANIQLMKDYYNFKSLTRTIDLVSILS